MPWDVHKGIFLILGKILKARKTGTTNLKKTHLLYPVTKDTRTQLVGYGGTVCSLEVIILRALDFVLSNVTN